MSTDDERQGKRSFNEAEIGLTEDLVEAIADQLGTRAKRESSGLAALGERKDLEPSALAVLMTVFGTRAEKDRRVLIPGWSGVGNVNLLLRRRDPEDALAWMCELKWCGPGNDVLYEAIWDLFKMALGKTREDHPATFLMTGAQKSLWAGSAFADIFETKNHVSEELCQRRLPDRRKTIAWDDLLRGGYDKHPEHVPAEITTESVGRATIGDWELRAVRIGAVSHDLIPMTGGWPRGARPADARHPSFTPKPPTPTPECPEPTRASSSPESLCWERHETPPARCWRAGGDQHWTRGARPAQGARRCSTSRPAGRYRGLPRSTAATATWGRRGDSMAGGRRGRC